MAPETLSGSFLIHNAKTVSHGNVLEYVEILVDGEKIAGVGKPGTFRCPYLIDAQGLLVFPGLVDPHVHLRDSGSPHVGQQRKEDFTSGSRAAIAGGFTTVLDMPNTIPPTATLTAYRTKRDHALKKSFCDFGLYALAGHENLDQVPSMLEQGCVAVKMYMGQTTGSNLLSDDTQEEKFFELSARHGFVLALHAENQECLDEHELYFRDKVGPKHSQVRPPECAALAVETALSFNKKYLNKTYFTHTSTAREVELIGAAKMAGYPVFMEITPHHLFFTNAEEDMQGNKVRMNPPLRTKKDVEALWRALNDGTADTVGSDHAPHLLEEKRLDYWDAPSGVPGLETTLPLLITAALEEKTTLENLKRLCAENPARIFGLHGKGRLAPGFDADFVFIDLKTEKPVDDSKLFTRCGWSPYAGKRLKGWPVQVFLRGRKVFEKDQPIGPFGKEVKKNAR